MRLNNLQAPPRAFPLEVKGITAAYRDKPVLWDVSFQVPEGQLVAIVGPNGAGKTTLLKIIMDLMKPAAGRATVYGRPFSKARQWVGYVPQRGSVDWDFPTNALDVVQMGLYGRLGWFRRPGRKERETAMQCLEKVGMADFADRQISQLSAASSSGSFWPGPGPGRPALPHRRALRRGGLQDRAGYRCPSAELKATGSTVVVVHHDLGTVSDYFDRVVLLNKSLVAEGPVEEALPRRTWRLPTVAA
jgi:manganese/zinc/iron transport system ATP- binding protein